MNDEDFQRLSFAATIAYGLLAALGLLLAGMWANKPALVGLALVCSGAAYLSQLFASHADASGSRQLQLAAYAAQAASLASWAYGLWVVFEGDY